MSQFIKFYFTSSMLNMFRTLIHPSSETCDFSIVSPHCLCVLVSCGDTIEKSQAPDHGCINVRNMLSLLQPATRLPPEPATPKLQHTSKQEHTTNGVIQ